MSWGRYELGGDCTVLTSISRCFEMYFKSCLLPPFSKAVLTLSITGVSLVKSLSIAPPSFVIFSIPPAPPLKASVATLAAWRTVSPSMSLMMSPISDMPALEAMFPSISPPPFCMKLEAILPKSIPPWPSPCIPPCIIFAASGATIGAAAAAMLAKSMPPPPPPPPIPPPMSAAAAGPSMLARPPIPPMPPPPPPSSCPAAPARLPQSIPPPPPMPP